MSAFDVVPRVGALPLRLGMGRQEVFDLLGETEHGDTTGLALWFKVGVHATFGPDDRLAQIGFALAPGGVPVLYKDLDLNTAPATGVVAHISRDAVPSTEDPPFSVVWRDLDVAVWRENDPADFDDWPPDVPDDGDRRGLYWQSFEIGPAGYFSRRPTSWVHDWKTWAEAQGLEADEARALAIDLLEAWKLDPDLDTNSDWRAWAHGRGLGPDLAAALDAAMARQLADSRVVRMPSLGGTPAEHEAWAIMRGTSDEYKSLRIAFVPGDARRLAIRTRNSDLDREIEALKASPLPAKPVNWQRWARAMRFPPAEARAFAAQMAEFLSR